MAERMKGNTASYFFSAFSGLVIKLDKSGESVWVQYYRPKGEETIYEEPKNKDIHYYALEEEGTLKTKAGFEWEGEVYFLEEFMRDNYMNEINELLAGKN